MSVAVLIGSPRSIVGPSAVSDEGSGQNHWRGEYDAYAMETAC
jgi:hypothetical protein